MDVCFLLVACLILNFVHTLEPVEPKPVPYTGQADKTLKLVQMTFRHGDRSPISIFPKDKYQIDSWPMGLGQLTPIGMEQAHELGSFLKNRYQGFISQPYNLTELHVQSSDIDRAILTAQNMLTGLYPSNQENTDHQGNKWRNVIVPVHSIPLKYDYLIALSAACPRYDVLYKKTQKTEKYTETLASFKDVLVVAKEKSGVDTTEATYLQVIGSIFDTLFCEKTHNKTLPSWSKEFYNKMMKDWFKFNYGFRFTHRELARFRGGALLQEMTQNMDAVIEGIDTRKMFVYSGHDTTVGSLSGALNIYNNKKVPYTATVILELHTSVKHNHTVKVFYRTLQELYEITVPGCDVGGECPYATFLTATDRVRPVDIHEECMSKPNHLLGFDKKVTVSVISAGLVIIAAAILFCAVRYVLVKRRRRGIIKMGQTDQRENPTFNEGIELIHEESSDLED